MRVRFSGIWGDCRVLWDVLCVWVGDGKHLGASESQTTPSPITLHLGPRKDC